jgi:hypothetical protein
MSLMYISSLVHFIEQSTFFLSSAVYPHPTHGKAEKFKAALDISQMPAHLLRPPLYWPAAVALLLASSISLDSAASLLVQALCCWYVRQLFKHPLLRLLQAARREEGDASLHKGDVVLDCCELHRASAVILLLLHPEHLPLQHLRSLCYNAVRHRTETR